MNGMTLAFICMLATTTFMPSASADEHMHKDEHMRKDEHMHKDEHMRNNEHMHKDKHKDERRHHKAHTHGEAKLAIAAEGTKVEIRLTVPGEALVGFEHAPKTDAEKAKVADAESKLKEKALQMFVFDPGKGCNVASTTFKTLHGRAHHENHSDIEASWSLVCKEPVKGSALNFGISKLWPGIKEIEVQALTDSGQTGKTLSQDEGSITL